jgi:hypothetical protein
MEEMKKRDRERGYLGRQTNGWTDRWMSGRIGGYLYGYTQRLANVQMHEWMDI